MRQIAWTLSMALAFAGCVFDPHSPAGPTPDGPDVGRADSFDDYDVVSLQCDGSHAVTASIATDESFWSDPFDAWIDTDESMLTLGGDLVRVHAPDDDGLWVELDEYTVTTDSEMLVFARPAGGQGPFRPVVVEQSPILRFQCPSETGPCASLEQEESPEVLSVEARGAYMYFHWFTVVRSFDPDVDAPEHNPTLQRLIDWLAQRMSLDPEQRVQLEACAARHLVERYEEHRGKDGLMFFAVPADWESHLAQVLNYVAPPAWLWDLAFFVPFEDIPALRDIAHEPLEWAVMGVPRTWSFWGLDLDWAGSFDYDLIVHCPGEEGCTAMPEGEEPNCGLPGAFAP